MKKSFFFLLFSAASVIALAQTANPVTWAFAGKKVSNGVYEVQMTATIQKGWHLYSQTQPKDAIAQPTLFTFTKNPLLELDGAVKETGKLEKFTDAELGVSANQYSNKVVFVQKLKLKAKAKTAVNGQLRFQACDDKKCLPPKTVPFSVSLS